MTESRPHVFSDAYDDRLADIEERHWWAAGVREIQRRLLDGVAPPARAWRVLDAGCGTGLTLTWVGRYTARQPVGLDRAPAGLRFCRRRGLSRLIEGDATSLPFPDGRFDLVLSCDVIQHLPRPDGDRNALAEMARVLVPGGFLLVRTNSQCGYPAHEPELDYHRYTLREVKERLGAAGFDVLTASYVNVLPALAVTLLRKLQRQRTAGNDPGLAARPEQPALVRALLYSLLKCEGMYLTAVKGSLPFGHSIIALARKRA